MKTSELTGAALDWAVAKCEGKIYGVPGTRYEFQPSTHWAQGGPIIERENISVICLDDEDISDDKGFWTGEKLPQWGAVIGTRHNLDENHGSQGDYWGMSYRVDEAAIRGPTPLIAAMRCYVASKLGDEVDVPKELT